MSADAGVKPPAPVLAMICSLESRQSKEVESRRIALAITHAACRLRAQALAACCSSGPGGTARCAHCLELMKRMPKQMPDAVSYNAALDVLHGTREGAAMFDEARRRCGHLPLGIQYELQKRHGFHFGTPFSLSLSICPRFIGY